jgi:flagellar hook-basal body complex protein FliE
MKISQIEGMFPKLPSLNKLGKNEDKKFGNVISEFINSVNMEQQNADKLTTDFIEGKNVELHQVMVATEKAKTSLELLMQIRNKAIDMYKELTRMQ